MIFKVSFLVVATVVAVTLSQKKQKNSSIKHKDLEKEGSRLQQIEEEEEKFIGNLLEHEEATTINVLSTENKLKNFDKNDNLLNLGKEFEQRKLTLQRKLLQLHGLKEQESYIARLRRNLDEKTAEMSTLTVTINLLRDEMNDLQKEIKKRVLAKKQLEIVKKMIDKLQGRIDAGADPLKGQLMILQEQVSGLQNDEISRTDMAVEEKLMAVEDLQLEVYELWRKNKELELEKRDLAVNLVAAQVRITALSSLTKGKHVSKIEELTTLRNANEDLSKQVERLQNNRFNMVEELVYQQCLNACLRFETEMYQIQSRKPTKRCSSTNSSHKFHEKTKQPLSDSEPNLHSISSCTSLTTEIDNNDSSSTNESSSSSQRNSTKKSIIIFNIKNWRRSIDNYLSTVPSPVKSSRGNPAGRNGLIRSFTTSMVPSKPSMLSHSANNTPTDEKIQDSKKSPETLSFPRARRVSFNDSITTVSSTFEDMARSVRGVVHNKEARTENSSHSPNANSSPESELAREIQELSSLEMVSTGVETKLNNRIEIAKPVELQMQYSRTTTASVLSTENKVEIHILHLIAVCFVFCFILLAYFLLLAAGIY